MQELQDFQVSDQRRFEQVIGKSAALESVLEQVERVAPTDSTVLIQGETGTGKELIARAVHNVSLRCGGPFGHSQLLARTVLRFCWDPDYSGWLTENSVTGRCKQLQGICAI